MSTCAQCDQPLEVDVTPSEDSDTEMEAASSSTQKQKIPDDVHLPCNCHYHWECLLDSSYELGTCPNCNQTIISAPSEPSSASPTTTTNPTQQILVNLNNEGGPQTQIDIFPLLQEESYLRAYPEERKSRAFLEFCREGDHRAIVDLLKSCSSNPDSEDGTEVEKIDDRFDLPNKPVEEILRYQDPIGDMQSGLHAAAANGHREVAWLLLLLASELSEMEFPALVFQEAAALGVMRGEQAGLVDIRGLRDAQGRTAEDVAREVGGVVWNGWFGKGWLALP